MSYVIQYDSGFSTRDPYWSDYSDSGRSGFSFDFQDENLRSAAFKAAKAALDFLIMEDSLEDHEGWPGMQHRIVLRTQFTEVVSLLP